MSFLDTIRNEIAAGFKGKLYAGVLYRDSGEGVDSLGDPVSSSRSDYTFNGFTDTYSAFYRAAAGIPATDLKVVIIAGSMVVEPKKDDKVKLNGHWYQIRAVSTDPATAVWTCQSFEIPEPL